MFLNEQLKFGSIIKQVWSRTSTFNENFLQSFKQFFFGGEGSLAVIKQDLSRNLFKPAAAVDYPTSLN